MKKTLFFTILFAATISCGQVNNKTEITEKTMSATTLEITAANVVDIMAKQVQRYDYEPLYYIRINKNYCLIEILVNDDIIYKDYGLSNLATPHNITPSILKSGKQTLTYRLYPVEDLIKQEYGYGDTVTTLVNNTSLSISIIEVDNRSNKKLDDEKVVMTHTAKVDNDGHFIASGKPFYEFTFQFEAKVPYELEGYTNGIDLRKVDSILLRPKVFQFYKKIKKLYLSKNKDEISKLRYNEVLRICQSNYHSKGKIEEIWDEIFSIIDNTYEVSEIENFKMEYICYDKVVFLKRKELGNSRFRGNSAFWLKYDSERGKRRRYIPLPLYCDSNILKEDVLSSFKIF